MRFNGKVAIVTGGSKGIGLATAQLLANEGASVAIVASSVDEDLIQQIRLEIGNQRVIGIRTNVADNKQVQTMVEQVVATFNGVDILVNSAGIQRYGDVVETEEDVWDEVMDVNVKGMYLTAKHAIPEMRKRGSGAIVNVSSIQAYVSQKQVVAYSASKGAINALTRAMAVDHAAENIRVNCVCPASVDTPMLRWAADRFKGESSQEDVLNEWGRMHPIGRVGKPEEVAEMIAYLCSDKAGFVTGGDFRIDGGLLSMAAVVLPE